MTGYVIGPWVRGARFYGREALLAALLAGGDRICWVAGCRRVGKTSLLRQLELLAPKHGYTPLVWDLQGADDEPELRLGLEDALLDAAATVTALGVASPPAAEGTVGDAIDTFAAAVRADGRTPLLLIDEAEELLTLATSAPAAVARLGTALAGTAAPRVVMTSSVRLARLGADAGVARWLAPALARPHWIGPLEAAAARAVVRQEHLEAASRARLGSPAVERIVTATGGHPYLTQLLAKRATECGDVDQAVASLAHDPAVRALVAVDLDLLEPDDRRLCEAIAAGRLCETTAEQLARLTGLGLIRPGAPGGPPASGHVFL